MHAIWNQYPEIKQELEAVIDLMDKNAYCKDKVIENSIKELVHTSGKMLRPGFSIIASKFGNYESERTQVLAAILEMFHMATLVHDDVIDEAKLRRGRETIQSKYGKNYAVYIGDYLFCICFKLLAQTASLHSIQMDSKAMSRICLGEVEQLNSRFDQTATVKDYLKRISGKTAELFALSLYLGAAESECNKNMSRLFWNIGYNIGMAFQIIDDVLDYTSVNEVLGKESNHDVKEGVYTLPLIYALEKKPQVLVDLLSKESYTNEDVELVKHLVFKYEGVEKARVLAKKYTAKAFKLIAKLPDNQYKEMLKEITALMLDREY
ncbi:polyprenyl synthetase family protein [Cellulosilyticum ruminicola]|uniref:polyprenyl synthetase family protein n=1 Tax=Cellulosilyticum ruminicola TaxID=425254 RepID=UPI0006D03432|nr:polyprenyl synthetase family protein [Cellulosilyticum ruminicola]